MTSSRTCERWTTIAALFVLISQIMLPGRSADAAAGAEALLPPTPLVLKDGRIANVSIHLLPFDHGAGKLAGGVASRLADLTTQLATDCFLTAQVIGHVSSREVAENETLAAHRLARSRADAVQASLIGGGLPAKSIASVWDWQFLVREPRATLWVFRLVQGEDCEGAPLDGDGSALVADNDAAGEAARDAVPAQTATAADASAPARNVARAPEQADPPRSARSAPRAEPSTPDSGAPGHAGLSGVVASASAAEVEEAPGVADAGKASDGQTLAAASAPGQVAMPAGPASGEAPALTRPLPALSPAQPDARPAGSSDSDEAETSVAALDAMLSAVQAGADSGTAAQQSAHEEDPERKGKVEWGSDGDVVITFATNSSYFPPGTARRLSTLLGRLTGGESYRVQLAVGESGSDSVVGATSPEEARRYNRWLAERRMNRVREWLDENAQDRQLEIEPAFVADDSARRVVVRVSPAG